MLAVLLPPVLSNAPIVLLLLSAFPRLHEVSYPGFVCPAHSSTCHDAFSANRLLREIPHPPVFDYRPHLI